MCVRHSVFGWDRYKAQTALLRLLGAQQKLEKGNSELVGHLHSPIVAGLQPAVDALKYLASGDRSLFPRCVRVWQLFTLQVGLMRIVIDMEKITRHLEQAHGLIKGS
jgi:hypothetical protein